MKSKMLSLLHGESYSKSLVPTGECIQQIQALKTGMCKTFQLSQELKGNTRQSARLAAKRRTELTKKEATQNSTATNVSNSPNIPNASTSSVAGNSTLELDSEKPETNIAKTGETATPVCLKSSQPPPPPPLPSHVTESVFPKSVQPGESLTLGLPHPLQSITNTTPSHLKRCSPRVNSATARKNGTICGSATSLTSSFSGSVHSVDGPFLTPMLTTRMLKAHKRSHSNSSIESQSTPLSVPCFQAELTSSNPIARLRATQINRSPGGTPVRSKSAMEPSEPLHKALFTAMKSKFKNVKTPSPKSGNSSRNNSALNSTFSP
ncbi:unnamed protein product [Lymnaea stagnalis]|uniref:Uncharacterized protein n=1 Tax=Lymnaea stagnalis TaxID=6523 RepID=A0AAV2HTC7_LYMST